MSVLGFDIGNYKSSIGLAKQGGIEIIDNEYSDRITPSYVSFTNRQRFQGHSAKQMEITHSSNTIYGFKRLIGRKYNDPQVQHEQLYQPLRISHSNDDRVLYHVDYMNEEKKFSVEQIMAMFLSKLKTISESHLPGTKVMDCVISVPSFMTDTERRALLDATQIAGLNCLKLVNETTAVALNYGLYNSNLPDVNDKPQLVAFIDMGYTQTQASIVAFNKGKLKVIGVTYDQNLGGRDFDKVLMDYFQQEFKTKYNLDAYSNTRARLRLRTECEKIKKLMSANNSPIPLNIECFMNDKDVSGRIKRDEFEGLASNTLNKFKHLLQSLLKEANLSAETINCVEIVGGSTRVPAVKKIINEVFGKEPSTTLNADEAVARGCTIMCAILSPTFKVKEFKIEDCQLFPITLNWKGAETEDNELEVFTRWDKVPMSKLLTIYKKEPFEIEARYRFPNDIPYNDPRIGRFSILNVIPNANGENSEVKIKARITKNGIFEISSPQMVEVVEPGQDGENMDVDGGVKNLNESVNSSQQNAEQGEETKASGEPSNEQQSEKSEDTAANQQSQTGAKKRKTKLVDLQMNARVPQLSKSDIQIFNEQELSMIQQDRKEREIAEAKNSVEEYIYEIRDKISNEFDKFILPEHKTKLQHLLEETESWLYSEEAENQEKNVYVNKLQKLKDFGEPAQRRFKEHEERQSYFEDFGKSLQQISKVLNLYQAGDEKYAHLDKADVERAAKQAEDKQRWLDEKIGLLRNLKSYEDPPVLCSQIKSEKEAMEKVCWPILNKPKPKAEKPKDPPPQPSANNNGPQQPPNDSGTQQQPQQPQNNMDVD